MTDYLREYLLIDEDGEFEFIHPPYDPSCLSGCSWPTAFRISELTGGGYLLEKLNEKDEWEPVN